MRYLKLIIFLQYFYDISFHLSVRHSFNESKPRKVTKMISASHLSVDYPALVLFAVDAHHKSSKVTVNAFEKLLSCVVLPKCQTSSCDHISQKISSHKNGFRTSGNFSIVLPRLCALCPILVHHTWVHSTLQIFFSSPDSCRSKCSCGSSLSHRSC